MFFITREHFSRKNILNILRPVELNIVGGKTVESVMRMAGADDTTHYKCRKTHGGIASGQESEYW